MINLDFERSLRLSILGGFFILLSYSLHNASQREVQNLQCDIRS